MSRLLKDGVGSGLSCRDGVLFVHMDMEGVEDVFHLFQPFLDALVVAFGQTADDDLGDKHRREIGRAHV